MSVRKDLLIFLSCVLLLCTAGGCATKGEKMVQSFGKTRER